MLLAFATARRQASDDAWNDILLRRSSTEGSSWSAPLLVHGEQHAATIDNPCPIYDYVHNRTVLLFMRNMHSMWLTASSLALKTFSSICLSRARGR